ncbi:hypothetical protein B0T17DRAFT_535747 [Bombardia bombarda]|uniref:Rhodopsin domain-containing protein n=1 Tax=Bombardia bombarda TaxID=252184 RepID=A0AA40C2L3_9PEZI|nr:hypothetical protein B0T17DRAFT_535747 [Bombardia bombarda]
MRLPPAEIRAQWPTPNYTNPTTRGPGVIIVELFTLAIAIVCLVLRLYVRMRIIGKSGLDDWIMVASMFFAIGVSICVILATKFYGWDRHIWDLTLPQMIQGRQISIAIQALFLLSSSLAKVSILVSYLRIAPRDSKFRRLTNLSIILVVLGCVAHFIVLWAQCLPTSSYWDILNNHRDCIPEGPPLLIQSIMTVLTDFIVWVLPLPTFFHARLPFSQRLALIVLFSFGLFVVFAGSLRTYWIYYVIEKTYDPTWEGFNLWIWTALEAHLGVICGCVPWLKSLVTFKKTGGTSSARTGTGGGTGGMGSNMPGGGSKNRVSGKTPGDGYLGSPTDRKFPSRGIHTLTDIDGERSDDDIAMASYDGSHRTSSTAEITPKF